MYGCENVNNDNKNQSAKHGNSKIDIDIDININDYKKINSKTNIDLYKNKNLGKDEYYINFTIQNNKYDLEQLIETSIINMLKEFNKDLLEDFIIEENEVKTGDKSYNNGTIKVYLHSPNKDMGISKKYIHGVFSVEKENSIIHFKCNSESDSKSDPSQNNGDDVIYVNGQKYKKITLENFEARIDCRNKHHCVFSMLFNINIHEDLPIYMLNMRGIMIAKICNNLKMFIEQM